MVEEENYYFHGLSTICSSREYGIFNEPFPNTSFLKRFYLAPIFKNQEEMDIILKRVDLIHAREGLYTQCCFYILYLFLVGLNLISNTAEVNISVQTVPQLKDMLCVFLWFPTSEPSSHKNAVQTQES